MKLLLATIPYDNWLIVVEENMMMYLILCIELSSKDLTFISSNISVNKVCCWKLFSSFSHFSFLDWFTDKDDLEKVIINQVFTTKKENTDDFICVRETIQCIDMISVHDQSSCICFISVSLWSLYYCLLR